MSSLRILVSVHLSIQLVLNGHLEKLYIYIIIIIIICIANDSLACFRFFASVVDKALRFRSRATGCRTFSPFRSSNFPVTSRSTRRPLIGYCSASLATPPRTFWSRCSRRVNVIATGRWRHLIGLLFIFCRWQHLIGTFIFSFFFIFVRSIIMTL